MPLDSGIIEAFIQSARDALGTMAMMDLEIGETLEEPKLPEATEILATIGLSGEHEGVLYIACSQKFASEFVAAMLGMEADEVEAEDLKDGAGEFVNMVAGGAKRILSETGHHFDLALPSVIMGSSSAVSAKNAPSAQVDAHVGVHELSIIVYMH